MTEGWRCPKCGRGNAPWVFSCQCGPDVTVSSKTNWLTAVDIRCRHGNTACPTCNGRTTNVS